MSKIGESNVVKVAVISAITSLLTALITAGVTVYASAQEARQSSQEADQSATSAAEDARVANSAASEANAHAKAFVPEGALILMQHPCPSQGYLDVSSQFAGRLVLIDEAVTGAPTTHEGDGTHKHEGGQHLHSVDLLTSPLGIGQRKGTLTRDTTVPHENTRLTVKGDTLQAPVSLAGGEHTHAAIGVRLCLKRTSEPQGG